jgi:glycosyltransferase involved in cell wall biosynthesis
VKSNVRRFDRITDWKLSPRFLFNPLKILPHSLKKLRMLASRVRPALHGIALCTVGELFGGVERHVLGLISELQALEFRPTLLVFHDSELATQARQQGIEPIILLNRNRSLLQTSRRIASLLKQRRIGVVHVHGYKAMVFCSVARQWHRFAMVRTEHGLPELMTDSTISALRARLYHLLDEAATRITGTTVCYVTEELKDYHCHRRASLPTIVIPNGVSPIDRRRLQRPAEFPENAFNLVAVGRLDKVKGFHIAITAAAVNSLPPNLHLHIVGAGPCESELRALAQDLGVSERVHFLGFRRNVYDFIAHCDALLMPSLHEGLPYTLLEGMALGTPIIASRVGGLAEVLQDEITALLVPPSDVGSLAHAILRLHDSPALRLDLGAQAQRVQQARYSLKAMTESYLGIYRALLANGS